jgi:hypothetical protein
VINVLDWNELYHVAKTRPFGCYLFNNCSMGKDEAI